MFNRPWCWRRAHALASAALCVGFVLTPGVAGAQEIDATLTTLVSGRQDPRDDRVRTVVPIFELISVRVRDLDLPLMSDTRLVVGAWGRIDPGEPADDGTSTGDVQVAYLEGTAYRGHVGLRAGRQLMIGGSARNLLVDGLSATYHIGHGFGTTVYGGHPVTPRFVVDRGDAVAGTRAFWKRSTDSEVGLSFIHLRDDGRIARQDVGVDGRHALWKTVDLTGYALASTTELRVAELDVGAVWRASRRMQVGADYRLTAPDLFLSRGSILAVFSEEQRHEGGANLWYRPRPRIRLSAEAYALHVESGAGFRGGGRAMLYFGDKLQARVGTEARALHSPSNGYQEARLFTMYRASPALTFGWDADAYHFEDPVNGEDYSLTTVATGSYSIGSRWHATLVGLGGMTPFLERRLEVMAKLSYGAVQHVREVVP